MSSNSNAAQGGKEDYLDKGLDQAEKKFGGAAGQDSGKNRAVNEKIVCPYCPLLGLSTATGGYGV